MNLFDNLITGSIVLAICMIIQCIAIVVVLKSLNAFEKKSKLKSLRFINLGLLVGCILMLFVGNLIQTSIWAGVFYYYGEFSAFSEAFFHSMVNFSTLGYGDFVMSEERKLLGAIEAINGVLMFGLSTGFLYTVLNLFMRKFWDEKIKS